MAPPGFLQQTEYNNPESPILVPYIACVCPPIAREVPCSNAMRKRWKFDFCIHITLLLFRFFLLLPHLSVSAVSEFKGLPKLEAALEADTWLEWRACQGLRFTAERG